MLYKLFLCVVLAFTVGIIFFPDETLGYFKEVTTTAKVEADKTFTEFSKEVENTKNSAINEVKSLYYDVKRELFD